jgi:hypothetical protein
MQLPKEHNNIVIKKTAWARPTLQFWFPAFGGRWLAARRGWLVASVFSFFLFTRKKY